VDERSVWGEGEQFFKERGRVSSVLGSTLSLRFLEKSTRIRGEDFKCFRTVKKENFCGDI
jgi:hypothetical protein